MTRTASVRRPERHVPFPSTLGIARSRSIFGDRGWVSEVDVMSWCLLAVVIDPAADGKLGGIARCSVVGDMHILG